MGFRVGDKVVHPSHGAGVICGIETHAINTDVSSSYYVISLMTAGSRRVMVPVKNVLMIGLRSAMARNKASEVLEILSGRPVASALVWAIVSGEVADAYSVRTFEQPSCDDAW